MKRIEEKLAKVLGVKSDEEMDVSRLVYVTEDGTIAFTAEAVRRIINGSLFDGLAVLVTPPHADEFRMPDTWVAEAQAIRDGVVIRNASARRGLSAANAEEGIDPYTGCQNAALAALVRNMGIYPPVFTKEEKEKLVALLSGTPTETDAEKIKETKEEKPVEVEVPARKRGRPAGISKATEAVGEANKKEVGSEEASVAAPTEKVTTTAPVEEAVTTPIEEAAIAAPVEDEITEADYALVLKAPARFKGMSVKEACEKASSDSSAKNALRVMLKSHDFTARFPKEVRVIKALLGE